MSRHLSISLLLAAVAVSCGTAANLDSSSQSADHDDEITVGYGSVSRSAQAFSVSEAMVDDAERATYKDIFDYLRGKVAGVEVTENANGGTPKIIVRGSKNVWGNDPDPLFLLDGQMIPDPSVIRPEEVYSVQVLKDAAASAYGSRSSNGVIMFKTVFAHEKEVQEAEMRRAEKEAKKAAKKKK